MSVEGIKRYVSIDKWILKIYDNSYTISYRGYEDAINGYILKVTVKDAVSNQTIFFYEF